MAEQSKVVTVKTKDGELFTIEQDIAKQFGTLNAMMDEESLTETLIPLHNVGSSELTMIIKYCRKHSEFRSGDYDRSGDAMAFNDSFVKDLSHNEVMELAQAASYLHFQELLNLLCLTMANRIKNKSAEWVRKFFGIENDFTPEEENELRNKNAWAYEGVDDD